MRRLVFALVAALLPAAAIAQYEGPAVETCRRHAEQEMRKGSEHLKAVIFDKDSDLQILRYTRKVGSQFVSSLLEGNGAIVYRVGVPVEFRFLCMLADEKRAVFFYWLPRRNASVLAQCRRDGAAPQECVETLLQVAERELIEVYAKHITEALKAGGEPAADKFRASGGAWKAYRDAECGRRANALEQKACVAELTRQRAADLR
jgi:uncharacterized protein YecT (DUF1311 family)